MKKEVVIKVLKSVGAVVVTGLGIKAIAGAIQLKKQRNQLIKEICRAEVDIKTQEIVINMILDENEKLLMENESLKNPEPKKKKA